MEGPEPLGSKPPQPWQGLRKPPLPQAGALRFCAATSRGKVPLACMGAITHNTVKSVRSGTNPAENRSFCFCFCSSLVLETNKASHQGQRLSASVQTTSACHVQPEKTQHAGTTVPLPPLLLYQWGCLALQLLLQPAEVTYQQCSNHLSQRKRRPGAGGVAGQR